MPFDDPLIWLHDWRSSLYRADEARIDRFLDAIESTLPPGWTRDREFEQTCLRPEGIYCYLFDLATDTAVRLWLQRTSVTRVRGGPVEILRHPPSGYSSSIGQLIAEFVDGCLMPAADAEGVRRTRPSFGVRSVISHPAVKLFIRLADTADGEWPLVERARGAWDDLISGCLAEQVGVHRGELERWLADSGWEPHDVAAIADRFFADSDWLAKRLAVLAS